MTAAILLLILTVVLDAGPIAYVCYAFSNVVMWPPGEETAGYGWPYPE